MLIPFVSQTLTRKIGIEFGIAPVSESVYVPDQSGDTLFLPRRLRTLESIIEHPTWDGTAWGSGFSVAADSYYLGTLDRYGTTSTIVRHGNQWYGDYVVTGVWGNQPLSSEIPPDITYITTYIVAELYKKQAANPAGFQGPEGYTVPIRDAFKEPEVKSVLHAYCYDPVVFAV